MLLRKNISIAIKECKLLKYYSQRSVQNKYFSEKLGSTFLEFYKVTYT